MQIREIRRRRLRQLIRERFDGVKARLATSMEWPATDVSRFFTPGKNGRSISERKAREIERACGLKKYWLDDEESMPLGAQQPLPIYNISETERAKLLEAYSYLTPEQQEDIVAQMRAYREANEAAVRHLGGRLRTVTRARAAEKLPAAPKEKMKS